MDRWFKYLLISLILGCLAQLYWTNPLWGLSFFALGSASAFGAAISSRARSRDNVTYHFIASVTSSFAFFLSYQQIMQNKVPLAAILPYALGCALGRVNGAKVAMKVERIIGAASDSSKEIADKTKLRNTLILFTGLCLLLVIQVFVLQIPFFNKVTLGTIGIAFVDQMAFSMRTWAQNRNVAFLIVIANVFAGLTAFFTLGWLYISGMPWSIFLPFTISNTAGSITGSLLMAKLGRKADASADKHVKTQEVPTFSLWYYYTMLALVVVNFLLFNRYGLIFTAMLLVSATCKNIAFALVSRAGNRNDSKYHFLAAIASNGIWFISAYLLIGGANMDYSVLVPYVCAFAAGDLVAVSVAMRIETKIGALADGHLKPKAA